MVKKRGKPPFLLINGIRTASRDPVTRKSLLNLGFEINQPVFIAK
jgi:hypothetical protein